MIYTDIFEYNKVGDLKVLLLRLYAFISKVKSGVAITTGEYRTYQTVSNLQFRRLLKNSFHSVQTDLRDTPSEKFLFGSRELLDWYSCFRKCLTFIFEKN